MRFPLNSFRNLLKHNKEWHSKKKDKMQLAQNIQWVAGGYLSRIKQFKKNNNVLSLFAAIGTVKLLVWMLLILFKSISSLVVDRQSGFNDVTFLQANEPISKRISLRLQRMWGG